jgi:hypothetical protein
MTRRPHLNLSPRPVMASKPREDARTRPPADPVVALLPLREYSTLYGFALASKDYHRCAEHCAPEWARHPTVSNLPKYGVEP